MSETYGLLLAGGRSSRMGKDKAWLEVPGHQSLMAEVILEKLDSQAKQVLVSANNEESRKKFIEKGLTVITDELGEGPLSGVYAALDSLRSTANNDDKLLVLPCDAPAIPTCLSSRLNSALNHTNGEKLAAYVHDGMRSQHLFLLLDISVIDLLKEHLLSKRYSVKSFLDVLDDKVIEVDFSDYAESFVNLNTPQDLENYRATRA